VTILFCIKWTIDCHCYFLYEILDLFRSYYEKARRNAIKSKPLLTITKFNVVLLWMNITDSLCMWWSPCIQRVCQRTRPRRRCSSGSAGPCRWCTRGSPRPSTPLAALSRPRTTWCSSVWARRRGKLTFQTIWISQGWVRNIKPCLTPCHGTVGTRYNRKKLISLQNSVIAILFVIL